MARSYYLTIISLLLLDAPPALSGHQDLRRELASMKDVMTNMEGKLEKINTLYLTSLEKRMKEMESTLNSMMSKVADMSRKSLLLSEIHQDSGARKDLLQRISRSVDELSRKYSTSVGRKNKGEMERLDKLSENVQALFQIFGGMNRKLDDLQTRVERIHGGCPINDLKFYLTKKIDSLAASTALLSECLECDRDSLKDVLHTSVRNIMENMSKRLHLCTTNDLERTVGKILDSKLKTTTDTLQEDISVKLGKVGHQLDDVKQECVKLNDEEGSTSVRRDSHTGVHDIAYSHDTPQELRAGGKHGGEDSGIPKETPGRIFRKLWRKMTEPINKVGEKIEALAQVVETSNQKHHNETVSRLTRELSGKDKVTEPCTKQLETVAESTKETAQRLGYIESRQLTVQNMCSKILVEVERMRNTVETGKIGIGVGTRLGVTETLDGAAKAGYEVAKSCAELQEQGIVTDGVYNIKPNGAQTEFLAYCDLTIEGGGWTVIQRRGDYGEHLRQNFTQGWDAYQRGFGDFQREFWLGNEKISLLSTQEDVKLRVELEDFEGNTAYAEYSRFRVADEKQQFLLSVGEYQGNATDSLSLHDGKMFSTEDRDNDEVSACCNCADTFKGGWWYYRCFEANLNGPYQTNPTDNGYFLGIIWERWKGDYSLKSSEMKIRPLSFDDVRDP